MSHAVESLLTHYESGRMSRRDLVALLTALAAAPRTGVAQPAALKAATLNHASLIVSDLDRSVAFYQRTFGLAVKSTQQGGVNLAVGDASWVSIRVARMQRRTSIISASASVALIPPPRSQRSRRRGSLPNRGRATASRRYTRPIPTTCAFSFRT
jgi:hypothetical protein